MSLGNWGWFDRVRSRGSRRRRVVLSAVSVAAGALMIGLALQFDGGTGVITTQVAPIVGLLILAILVGLRPWARE